jgi:hypothetical protein
MKPPKAIMSRKGSSKVTSNWLDLKKLYRRVTAKTNKLMAERSEYIKGMIAARGCPSKK